MIDGPIRNVLPRMTGPLMTLYGRLGVTPNQITFAGLGVASLAAGAAALGLGWVAVVLWWLSRLLDGTDGIYARHTGQVTDFGGYLDIVVDMAAYGVMILGLRLWHPELDGAWATILFLYVLCITSALALGNLERQRGGGDSDNRTLKLATGLAEAGETGIAYTIFLLFPAMIGASVSLWIIVLLTTVLARSVLASRVLRGVTP